VFRDASLFRPAAAAGYTPQPKELRISLWPTPDGVSTGLREIRAQRRGELFLITVKRTTVYK
jgi:hypothetical protein